MIRLLVIDLPGVPAAQAAFALHNRGYCKSFEGDAEGAAADYRGAINLANDPHEAVNVAREKLAAIVATSGGAPRVAKPSVRCVFHTKVNSISLGS
jgi:hypothetical protein